MNRWFCNGDPAPTVSTDDRAFQYGDGLFETIAVRDGKPRLWQYHLDRLERGCRQLRLIMPKHGDLLEWLDAAIQKASADTMHCTAKLILSSGVSERGYFRKTPTPVRTYLGVYPAIPLPASHYQEGVDTITCNTRLALYPIAPGCKTLNRLEQVIARSEFKPSDAFEGLTLDAAGRLICGTMSNVFIVAKQSIITPSLDRCGVEGVMRRHVLTMLSESGTPVEVRDIDAAEVLGCDEVFLTNSQFGVLPVRRCDDKQWHEHAVTFDVMAKMAAAGIAEPAL